MDVLPAVIRAEYCGEFKIRLVFNDGVEGTVDFADWLSGPVFEPLKDPDYFAAAETDVRLGVRRGR